MIYFTSSKSTSSTLSDPLLSEPAEEEEEFDDVTLNFASLLCASMNLDVKSINSNGEITLTAKLEDINKFLREMLSD